MEHFSCIVRFSKPPPVVYRAITTQKGLAGWWTADCDVAGEVGEPCTFRFGRSYNVMRLADLIPNREVRWECVDQYHHAPGRLHRDDEWIGSVLVFKLFATRPNGTELRFEHRGLEPVLDCYSLCEAGWNHFLRTSLKEYVESGIGRPFVEGSSRLR